MEEAGWPSGHRYSATLEYAPQTRRASAEFYRDVLGMEIVGRERA